MTKAEEGRLSYIRECIVSGRTLSKFEVHWLLLQVDKQRRKVARLERLLREVEA